MVSEKPPEDEKYSNYSTLAMTALDIPQTPGSSVVYQAMLKYLRLWGLVLIGFGILNVFMSGLPDSSWGILLIVVGSASFIFKDAAMYVIYGITMLWAAVSNASSDQARWIAISAIQLFLAIGVFRSFIRYRRAESDLATAIETTSIDSSAPQNRAERFFPALGCFFGALSLFTFVISFLGILILVAMQEETTEPSGTFELFLGLAIDVAVLGFAINLAALLSRFRHKILGILGLIASTIPVVVYLVVLFTEG